MTNWNRDQIAKLIVQAGGLALEYFDIPIRETKRDKSIVTQADRAVETFLSGIFEDPEAGAYVIGEETVETKNEAYVEKALRETAWILDPIDGTSSYAYHFPMWGVSIGFARKGKIVEGALYLPLGGELLVSDGEDVYFGRVFRGHQDPASQLSRYEAPAGKTDTGGIISLSQGFAKKGDWELRTSNYVHIAGSCVFSLTHIILGGYISYVSDLKLWDLAGGLPLFEKLGFQVRFGDGRPFGTEIRDEFYNLSRGDPGRWKTKGKLIFARDEVGWDYCSEACGFKRQ